MAEFIVKDPSGKEFVINAPEGATQEQALEYAKSQFSTTAGGAATGNPMIRRQGERRINPQSAGEAIATIGGAGVTGAALGAVAPELLQGAATVASGMPAPISGLRGPLSFASSMARSIGRPAGAITGATSGLASETAGQVVEAAGGKGIPAEAARFVAGGVTGETLNGVKKLLQWKMDVPALGFESKIKKEAARALLEKLNAGVKPLSAKEQEFLDQAITEVRGGAKSNESLENVGSIMGAEGNRLMNNADMNLMRSLRGQNVGNAGGYPAQERNMAEIGSELQNAILKRNEAALQTRAAQFKENELARDSIVRQMEASGKYPKDLPIYADIVTSLERELAPGVRSPEVAKGFQNILAAVKTQDGSPVTFQRIDDLRRQLGEVFRGKPPEGYAGIDADTARKYYGMLSELQKSYAGGRGGPQERLLEDYAARTQGLEVFSSRLGKKVTALDQYREGQYPDPSAIPASFFKTRASVQALKELTGNPRQVEDAALAYANRELAGKNSQAVRAWRNDNAEWLNETGTTKRLIDSYASRLEASERSLAQAKSFAAEAEKDASMLTRKALPAQRAVDLIKSGDTELWAKVIPAINQSPQAKVQMVSAARQVLGDMATTRGASDFFSRNLRPFLEGSGIATKSEMDSVAASLDKIQKGILPEEQKLGMAKRLLLNSFGGYSASTASRAGVGGYGLMSDLIPQ